MGSSVQFSHSVMSDSLWPHGPQHARPPCPSPTPAVYPNVCSSSWWCHPTISSSVVPFSSCPQSFPASGSFHGEVQFLGQKDSFSSLEFQLTCVLLSQGRCSFQRGWWYSIKQGKGELSQSYYVPQNLSEMLLESQFAHWSRTNDDGEEELLENLNLRKLPRHISSITEFSNIAFCPSQNPQDSSLNKLKIPWETRFTLKFSLVP